MIYQNRQDAGQRLAEKLSSYKRDNLIVLALPRGGVPVGFEIARRLNIPLDVLVSRKLGAPSQPELGVGAIAPGVKILDNQMIKNLNITPAELDVIEQKEKEEMKRRIRYYRGKDSLPEIKDKTVILVDDGLATGVTARAAIKAILKQKPAKLIIAIPVCALESAEAIKSELRRQDEFICLATPEEFISVGLWYQDFSQVSDSEVIELLRRAKQSEIQGRPVNRNIGHPRIMLH